MKSVTFTMINETSKYMKMLFLSLKNVYFVNNTNEIFENIFTMFEVPTNKTNKISSGLRKKNNTRGIKFNCFILIVRNSKNVAVIN